ncbi:MBL fold metallo-hydrolase [Alicyclobacillus fastidiosus]|uniref:MBL fold metallo-hydrolase n=1 Tax=Alicyclobacillus fastidiosus TaxID=392011 RepID=A0ABV5AL59_9BACL|nr:MBL fold metallo-hydrolase [Alicyclobacillus fastidiosus]WEH08862.1 MBL fold metallo-hydrolase [Alicyclobacillus fastidiosus]
MFQFVGCGSAFHTQLGNNSAYLKSGSHLFMIDCGSANFDRILRANLLAGVDEIAVLVTHLHPDHVGSLGDLLFYSYYSVPPAGKAIATVLTPKKLSHDFRTLIKLMGVTEKYYRHVEISDAYRPVGMGDVSEIKPVPVQHSRGLTCFGYLLEVAGKRIYYSGDANMIPTDVLEALKSGQLDYVYQDTSKAEYAGNVHLSLRQLTELIPPPVRQRVYCMHLDPPFQSAEATSLGFQVVSPVALANPS